MQKWATLTNDQEEAVCDVEQGSQAGQQRPPRSGRAEESDVPEQVGVRAIGPSLVRAWQLQFVVMVPGGAVHSGAPHRPRFSRMAAKIRWVSCDWPATPAGRNMQSEEAVRHGEAFDRLLPSMATSYNVVCSGAAQSSGMSAAWSSGAQK
jgi:hypothetical protein